MSTYAFDHNGNATVDRCNINTYFCVPLELVAKWLRDEKKIYIDITWDNMQSNIIWCSSLNNFAKGNSMLGDIAPTSSYEEALSVCIDKAIEILKEKAAQAASIDLVTYFSPKHLVAINSSIVIAGTTTIEVYSQFVEE